MQPAEQLPWELEEEILSLVPTKSLERFRCVCKRWNSLFNDRRILNKDLGLTRPRFILLTESKICSVDVNLDRLSIEVHNLPSDIPGYELLSMPMTIEYCDGLLVYVTYKGVGICNPWLRQIRWIKTESDCQDFNGMGYDNTRPDKHYKIFESNIHNNSTVISNITETDQSDAWRSNKCSTKDWYIISYYNSVSLNGTLYWVAFNLKSHEHFIQSFDFSVERYEPYCILPNKKNRVRAARSLAVFRIDRFSYLEQNHHTRNIEIWVTEEKIKNRDGKDVKWLSFMNVSVPQWSSLQVSDCPPSYFIDDKSLSLVLCCLNEERKGYIYIAKGDKFHELKINDLVDDYPRHRTYFPSLVPVPRFTSSTSKIQHVGARFTLPRGVEVSNGVGGNEWDDGFFDNVKKINLGTNAFGAVFVKFDYSKNNAIVAGAGAGHGNATAYIPEKDFRIADDDYIEAVEGTYTESHITSIMFRLHSKKRTAVCGHFNGIPFVLGGRRGSKIIGFYGKSSHVHLTAFGVHLSPSV